MHDLLSEQQRLVAMLMLDQATRDEVADIVDMPIALLKRLIRRACAGLGGFWSRVIRSRDVSCEVTYGELAAFASGEMGETRQGEIRGHLVDCDRCRERLALLNRADAALADVPLVRPARGAVQTAIVWAAIANLPDRQQKAISLHVFERRSYRQIAEALETSAEMARSLVHRARGNLARALEPVHRG